MERPSDIDLNILGRTELFRGVPDNVLWQVRAAATRRRLSEGSVLFQQGDPADTVCVVVVGRLRATQTTSDGQQIIIRYLGPGELAGYTALSGGQSHPGTVTAVEDTHILTWSATAIRDLMAQHPAIAMNALSVLGTRYHETQTRLRELSTEKVERRIAHAILRLARQAGRRTAQGIEIAIPLSRQDLAEMTGTTLHTVSRMLSAWESDGIVDSGRRRVMVRKPEALAVIAGEDG